MNIIQTKIIGQSITLKRVNSFFIKRSRLILLGFAFGTALGVGFLPGGFDAFVYYLRPPFENTTSPAWVYLITLPLSKFTWPLSWQILCFFTIILAGKASQIWKNTNWWVPVLSASMLWTIWLGQIEVFPVAGLIISAYILQKKIHPAWLGIAILALLTKPHVGYGPLILILYWVATDRDLGWLAILQGTVTCLAIIILTVVLWPDWPINWYRTLREFNPTFWNASIWPYGLISWPIVLFSSRWATKIQLLRMFSVASLLSSPYFALYHCLTSLTLIGNPIFLFISWFVVLLGRGIPVEWMRWGWILPVSILIFDEISLLSRFFGKYWGGTPKSGTSPQRFPDSH